jgi:hypothetical protein
VEKSSNSLIVAVPVKRLLMEWITDDNSDHEIDTFKAHELQARLNDKMRQLRKLSTELPIQKANLQISLILLDMIPFASNPFCVMHHAAMFASQSGTGGKMDLNFTTELPSGDCSPLRALEILARADCLQAVHFTREATYLCNFVARACRQRRNGPQWSPKWKAVGICNYNVAMAIRSTICSTLANRESQVRVLESWDADVVEELDSCRADALELYSEPGTKPWEKDQLSMHDPSVNKVEIANEGKSDQFKEPSTLSGGLIDAVNEVVAV